MKFICFLMLLCITGAIHAQQMPGFSNQSNASSVCEGLAFNSDEEAFNKVKEICGAMDIAGNFMVSECSNVDNCKAVLNSSGSYIFYNKSYLQKIKGLNFTEAAFRASKGDDWDVICILAHEIGHHVLQHLANFQQLSRIMPLVDMELEADKFAGACMYRLGATMEQAQHVMYDASISEKASLNHPARKERLDAIALGYNKAKAKNGGNAVANTPVVNTVNMPVVVQTGNAPVVNNPAPEPPAKEKISDAITSWSEGKYDEAAKVFREHGDNEKTWLYLAYAYYQGMGMPVDSGKAAFYFTKAADNGIAEAQYNIGCLYVYGAGVPIDYVLAHKYFRKAAEQEDANSIYALGNLYYNGYGVPADLDSAIKYFSKAAEKDQRDALYILGLMTYIGINIKTDTLKAFGYFKRSAELEYAEAQYWCAKMYESGEAVEKNTKEAYRLYKLAAKQNHQKAQESCTRLNIDWQ